MIVFVTYVCGFLSVWLVVLVTLENYIRICHPHRVLTLCTAGKARVILLVLCVLAVFCYNFPLWTTYSKVSTANKSRCSLIPVRLKCLKVKGAKLTNSTLKSPPLTSLRWKSLNDKSHRKSKVWEFMGVLSAVDMTSGRSCALFNEDLIHCKLCFEEQLKAGKDGHMSKIYCAKKSTASEFARFNEGLTYFDTAMTLVAPSVLVLLLMICIFGSLFAAYKRNKRMRKLGRQRHLHFFCLSPYGRVTAMLLAVSITFITLHTPSHAIRLRLLIGEILRQDPEHFLPALRLQRLFELLYYTNFATNYITYLVFGKTFRDLCRRYHCFCLCCKDKLAAEAVDQDSEFVQYVCDFAHRETAILGGQDTEVEKISCEAIMMNKS
ncbi:hypothetical protein Btru_063805 [Bulinus truncatus]|nr:hypothetical protein Btru_063805 [Bulinus truncatus]